MTAQGTAYGRFRRAIQHRNVNGAELAAIELGQLTLLDALALVRLYADSGSHKFEPAAVKWLARYTAERSEVRLHDVHLAAAALASLRGLRKEAAERILLGLL